MRGVYAYTLSRIVLATGPSPRAWGLLTRIPETAFQNRSIPTCVGFTHSKPGPAGPGTVHPHVRGVYASSTSTASSHSGPSPRAWGLRREVFQGEGSRRSIPTCVGFTLSCQLQASRKFGPSPRAWGLHQLDEGIRQDMRSIPTCVGFTSSYHKFNVYLPVHPHVRGVYFRLARLIDYSSGPSPRAWGLPPVVDPGGGTPRSIPTCVGFTAFLLYFSARAGGPSPRAWGLLRTSKSESRKFRSIPTCVGFTHLRRMVTRSTTVHPHVRGVYWKTDSRAAQKNGPSPRAWGLR